MIVQIMEWLAWAISGVLGAWMVFDAIKVSRSYSEEFLVTSIEGADELLGTEGATAAEEAVARERGR